MVSADFLQLPDHVRLLHLARRDLDVRFAFADRRIPRRPDGGGCLLLLGDDAMPPTGSKGPEAFDGPRLRRWLSETDFGRGVVGVFAGAPDYDSYASLITAATAFPRGAIIVECHPSTWCAWSRYVFRHAPNAWRRDVLTADIEAEARRMIAAEGAVPVEISAA